MPFLLVPLLPPAYPPETLEPPELPVQVEPDEPEFELLPPVHVDPVLEPLPVQVDPGLEFPLLPVHVSPPDVLGLPVLYEPLLEEEPPVI